MSRDREQKRELEKERKKEMLEAAIAGGEKKADCPCPKTDCKRYGYCTPCRAHHTKSAPYCERGYKGSKP